MWWEDLRDIGLLLVLLGGLLYLAGNFVHQNDPKHDDVLWVVRFGDSVMLAGACLAMIAIIIGFFLSGSPSVE
jgi:ABC-type transport system involved in multi-copper enzyme maturation permease subunit